MFNVIVIYVNEERKRRTQIYLEHTGIHKDQIYYLDASVIENSKIFLEHIPENINTTQNKKIMCCLKSHMRAINYAFNYSRNKYTIVLEDDVTFYKYNIVEKINELIEKWENNEKYRKYGVVYIGWIPMKNYSKYITTDPYDKLTNYENSNIINLAPVGTQGYIIKKSMASNKVNEILNSKSYIDLIDILRNNVNEYFGNHDINNHLLAADVLIPRILTPLVVFPPLVIERNEESTLSHTNANREYWNYFFKNNENKKNDYLNLDTNINN